VRTVLGETLGGYAFVLEHVTTIGPVYQDWDWRERKGWWHIGFEKVSNGYRFKITLSNDYCFVADPTEDGAKAKRAELIARLDNLK
jgi:hypothetical protein